MLKKTIVIVYVCNSLKKNVANLLEKKGSGDLANMAIYDFSENSLFLSK